MVARALSHGREDSTGASADGSSDGKTDRPTLEVQPREAALRREQTPDSPEGVRAPPPESESVGVGWDPRACIPKRLPPRKR